MYSFNSAARKAISPLHNDERMGTISDSMKILSTAVGFFVERRRGVGGESGQGRGGGWSENRMTKEKRRRRRRRRNTRRREGEEEEESRKRRRKKKEEEGKE